MKTLKISVLFLFIVTLFPQLNTAQTLPVYKHFIIYGQSFGIGHQSYPGLSLENVPGNYMIGNEILINHCNYGIPNPPNDFNPLVAVWDCGNEAKTRETMVRWENPLIGTVNHVQKKDANFGNIIATSTGTGGKTIEELSKGVTPNLYNDFLKALNYSAAVAKNKNYHITSPALFWVQGEGNYNVATTDEIASKNDYKSKMIKLKNDMQQDVMTILGQTTKPKFYTYQTGYMYTQGKTLRIGMAQLEASNEDPDIIAIGPIYPYTRRSGHLDPNGYRWFGEMMGKVFYKTQVLGEDFKPTQPMTIYRTDNPNILKIKFHVPVPPLVFDSKTVLLVGDWLEGNTYGFELFLNGNSASIKEPKIENGNTVIIETNSSYTLPGKTIEIRYAGKATEGRGNLRDSDPTLGFYPYIDLDGKNQDGSWIYPRDESETTLRPLYHEPKDNLNRPIYNKPYPLYNWSMAFYYKLEADQNELKILNEPTAVKDIKEADFNVRANSSFITLEGNSNARLRSLHIFDMQGKKVKVINLNNDFLSGTLQYSISEIPTGMYIANIATEKQSYFYKFLK